MSSHVNSSLAASSTSSGPRCCVRRWMIRFTSGPSRIASRMRGVDPGRDRFADQEALHLDREDDRDHAEQQSDADAAQRVPARVAGDLGEADADQREQQADERAGVLEQHDRELGALGGADEAPPRAALAARDGLARARCATTAPRARSPRRARRTPRPATRARAGSMSFSMPSYSANSEPRVKSTSATMNAQK